MGKEGRWATFTNTKEERANLLHLFVGVKVLNAGRVIIRV